jgi:hypothetical protein
VSTTRGYNWEAATSVQHELRSNIGLNVGYYRRWYGNQIVTDNELWSPADFSPFCITAPRNASLPNGGGYQVCGLYDIAPSLRSARSDVVKLAKNFGDQTEVYDGVDISANIRLPGGMLVAGGTSTGRVATNNCFVMDSPQQALVHNTAQEGNFCDVRPPFQTQAKAIVVYPFPWWGLQTSAALQSIPPVQLLANYSASNAEIQPSLGRVVSTTADVTVPLVRPGTLFGDRLNQVDFRIAKTFRFGERRFQVMYDLYNMLNASPTYVYNQNFSIAGPPPTIASRESYDWPVPQTILQGRIMKFGFQLDW